MSSFAEKKAMGLVGAAGQPAEFTEYCRRQIARVYPKGARVSSTNYDPQPCWNCGLQMVALNFQTPDKSMWLNHGKFRDNGGCGYLLKPSVMIDGQLFNPHKISTYKDHVTPCELNLRIISGRHLVKPKKGVISPFVEVEIVGVPNDNVKYKTRTIPDNGFNPVWNENVTFDISMPELACLAVCVYDEDMFGDTSVVAQSFLPIGSLREGWRSVQLFSPHNYPLELSSVLLHVDLSYLEGEDRGNYESIAAIREKLIFKNRDRDGEVVQKINHQIVGKDLMEQEKRLGQLNQESFLLEQQLLQQKPSKTAHHYVNAPPRTDRR